MGGEPAEEGVGGDEASGEDVVLAEGGDEDVAALLAVMVVDDAERAVGELGGVGVGDARAWVEEQAVGPGKAVVVGEEGGEAIRAGS